jgi:hypothetical protein
MATRSGQPYRYGWLTALGGLVNVVNPAFIAGLGAVLGAWGTALALMVAGWSLAVGVSAAAVRPWSWYVLLVSQLVGLILGALYMAFVALTWADRVMVAVLSLAMSAINFAYFYKRRALFRANGRWRWLERSWPGLIGPETLGPDVHPGFTGLSPLYRALFAAAVVMALAAQLLPGG